MKRRIAALTSMVLWIALAVGASAQTYKWAETFCVNFPDDWAKVVDSSTDTQDYARIITLVDTSRDDGLNISVEANHLVNWVGFTLPDEGEPGFQEYVDAVIGRYPGENMRFLKCVSTEADELPFAVFEGNGGAGIYRYAETLLDGLAVSFYGYAYEKDFKANRAWDDADADKFEGIITALEIAD